MKLFKRMKRKSMKRKRSKISVEKSLSSASTNSSSSSSDDELSLPEPMSLDLQAKKDNGREQCELRSGRGGGKNEFMRPSSRSLSFYKKERLTYFSLAFCLSAPFIMISNYRFFWWLYLLSIVCAILCTLSKKQPGSANFDSREVKPTVMFDTLTMKLSSNDLDLVQAALEILVKFTHRQQRKGFVDSNSRSDGIAAVLEAMQHYTELEHIQELACSALCNLLFSSPQLCKTIIVQKGGIDTIVAVMRRYIRNATIQKNACTMLWSIASGNAENKSSIARSGGIFCIVSAMKHHPNSRPVGEQACGALANLSVTPENQAIIAQQLGTHPDDSAILAIISIMERHVQSCVLQKRACVALSNLALNTENRVTIAERGGVSAILNAMNKHPDSPRVQEVACNALANLALDNVNNKETIGKQGGVQAVTTAMKNHPGVESLQKHACTGLADLSTNASNKARILRAADGTQVVMDTMSRHFGSSVVQEKSCVILANVATIDADHTICKSGGISSIVSAMEHHPNSVGVQSEGCWALQELSQLLCSCSTSTGSMCKPPPAVRRARIKRVRFKLWRRHSAAREEDKCG